jgi:hypothetical protein
MSSQQQLRAALADARARVARSTSEGFRALLSPSPSSSVPHFTASPPAGLLETLLMREPQVSLLFVLMGGLLALPRMIFSSPPPKFCPRSAGAPSVAALSSALLAIIHALILRTPRRFK